MTQYEKSGGIHNISKAIFKIMQKNKKIDIKEIEVLIEKEFSTVAKEKVSYISSNMAIKLNILYSRSKNLDLKEIEYIIKTNIEDKLYVVKSGMTSYS